MLISSGEAAATLRDVDAVGRQTRMAGGYAMASPHLILWGAVWIIGYVATGLTRPAVWGLVWLPLVLVGAIGGMLIAQRSRSRGSRVGVSSATSVLWAVAIAAFFLSVYTVFRPTTLAPYLVFPALVTALIYVAVGLYGWPRFGWVGALIFVATMGSYLFAEPWLPFCIALAGGGGLVLGGLWLRKV